MLKLILHRSGLLAFALLMVLGSNAIASEQPKTVVLDDLVTTGLQSASSESKQLAVNATEKLQPFAANMIADLQNLNSRYQCSPDVIDTTSSRAEFTAVLESCLNAMERKVANEPSSVRRVDLEELRQLAAAFKLEVTALNERLDKVEKVALTQGEVSQFSTTTKLQGEAIIALTDVFGSNRATANGSTGQPLNVNPIVANRVRLNFRTTFSGKDLLQTRLQARNTNSFSAPTAAATNMVRLGFEGSEENAVGIQLLQYQVPLSEQTKFIGTAVGNELDLYVKNFNPSLAPAGTGAISRFGRYNPIYRLSAEGAGIGFEHKFSKELSGSLAYAVPRVGGIEIAGNPAENAGVFGGSNLLFSQLNYSPSSNLDLGFIYARSYHSNGAGVSGLNGTTWANAPFRTPSIPATTNVPTSANHYSVLASTKLNPTTTLSGWAGLTDSNRETAAGGSASIWNAAVTLAFDNVGGVGSTLGFVLGVPPTITSNSGVTTNVNRDTPWHLETIYKYQVSKNLYITPGLVMILNPEGNSNNPTLFLGTIRTTFNF